MDERDISTTAEAYEASALPCARAVHTEPGRHASAEQVPLPAAVARKPVASKSPAEWAYERLILYIKNFEEGLNADEEVAMGFTGGEAGVMRIEGIGYFDPDIITFYGQDTAGRKTQFIQHVSQLGVTLRAMPKPEKREKPRRIGFHLIADLEEQAAEESEAGMAGDTAREAGENAAPEGPSQA